MSKHSHKAHGTHDHVADHQHAAPIQKTDDHQHGNAFALPFIVILVFAAIEYFGGLFTHSLALMGDAGHMLSDAAALGMAWFATHHAVLSLLISALILVSTLKLANDIWRTM